MKKPFLIVSATFAYSIVFSAVSLNFGVGPLYDENGVEIADGSLVQLIYLLGGETALSEDMLIAGNFVHATEVVLHSFAMDSDISGMVGVTEGIITVPLTDELTPGTYLAFRWWPTLQIGDVPEVGDVYGQSNPLYVVGGQVPADGLDATIIFMLDSLGGSAPDAALRANYQVVPEPSVYGFAGVAVLGALVAVRRRKRI